jgi:predicted SAM-dependent methyltransferase
MKQYLKTAYPDVVRILRLSLYELKTLLAHLRGRLSPRQRKTIRQLRLSKGLKLNIASGPAYKAGWVNIDVAPTAEIQMDLRRSIPLPSGCAEMIFCEHFCDHLNFPHEISRFLAECCRLLAPGGRARFVLHDAEDLMKACVERDARYFEVAEEVRPTMMESVNFLFRFNDGHQFLYDYETFERCLLAAGFAKAKRCKYLESELPELVLDFKYPSREVMSMYVEAVR